MNTQKSGIQGSGLSVEENVEAYGPREATPGDIFGDTPPASIWHFRATEDNGRKHPSAGIQSLYFNVQGSHGWLSGYVEQALFAHLMKVLNVEAPQS